MKITRISVYQFDYTVPKVYKLSGGRLFETLDTTIVEIETDAGISGVGEGCPFGVYYGAAHALGVRAGVEELAPRMIGMDSRDTDRINDMMDAVLPMLNYVKTPLDMACWDAFGKSVGLPVYALMGGHNGKSLPLASSVSTGTPEEMVATVQGFRDEGYKAHSVKVGGTDPSLDAERVAAIMAARGPDEDYILDANRGWSLESALRFAALAEPINACIEAPCKTYRECLSFKRRTGVPVSMDEHLTGPDVAIQVIADDAADVMNIKTTKVGGVSKARRIRDICAEAGLAMSIQETGGSDIAFAALVHIAQSGPADLVRHVWDPRELAKESLAAGAPVVSSGHVKAADRPGLGVTLNADMLGEPVRVFE